MFLRTTAFPGAWKSYFSTGKSFRGEEREERTDEGLSGAKRSSLQIELKL